VNRARLTNGKIEIVPIGRLKQHPRNPRKGNVEAIRKLILEHGFYGVLPVQRSTGFILRGNHTWLAAKAAGIDRVRVEWLDVDDDRALRIVLSDNRASDLAGYDDEALAEDLRDLNAAGGLAGTGFSEGDLEALLADLEASEFADVDKASTNGAAGHRDLGNIKEQVKAVLYPPQIAILEEALAATGEPNRGEALMTVCRSYLAAAARRSPRPRRSHERQATR
jgi:ParB-like chromosome segregation protein Spo0J